MATSFAITSFDNFLYFEMQNAEDDDPNMRVAGVSCAEAREILDSKIKRLAR